MWKDIIVTAGTLVGGLLGGGALVKLFFYPQEKKSMEADTRLKNLQADQLFESTSSNWIQRLERQTVKLEEKLESMSRAMEDQRKASEREIRRYQTERDAYYMELVKNRLPIPEIHYDVDLDPNG